MLANQLTLEEEDAVQAELLELQAASVSFVILLNRLHHPEISVGASNTTNVAVGTEGTTCCAWNRR